MSFQDYPFNLTPQTWHEMQGVLSKLRRWLDNIEDRLGTTTPTVGAAPSDLTYIVQTASANLSAEQAIGALATGILKGTTTTGVVSIAISGTDYSAPGHTHVAANVTDFSTAVIALLTDANIPNTITLDNITQITTRSHTSLSDIGTNAHSVIDTHLAASNPHSGSQPLDATLTALAALDATTGILTQTGADAFARGQLSGDVTTTGSSLAVTIAAQAVGVAKMTATQTDVFFGRDAVGAGAGEEITVAAAKTLLGLTGTNSGDQTITLTGDVTGTGTGSFAATIAADAVTYAKMQNVTTARLLGRATAGSGDTEEIILGTNLSFTGTTLNAAGGGGTPGGATTQLQYNNAGAFGGTSGLTWDGASLSLAAAQVMLFRQATIGIFSSAADSLSIVSVATMNLYADTFNLYDQSANAIWIFRDVASAVNYMEAKNSATTTALLLTAGGTDTDISINIVPKGAGRLQSAGVTVPTISSTDTLTNKSIAVTQLTGQVAVANGGTALSAIAALSLIVANSANVYVALTPGAGNSIRINAGGTAWEAYTPGAGGGTPGGSTTQVQYNNAGAFGGITGATTDGTVLTLVAPVLGAATATSINKVALTAPATSATLTLIDGTTLTGPASSGTVMTLGNAETVTGLKQFGTIGGVVGRFALAGSTSGASTLNAAAVAGGTLTLPTGTDTLAALGTAQTWTAAQTLGTTTKLQFRDTGLFINSSVDGQLDISADVMLSLGVVGDIKLGDTTLRLMSPVSTEKISLGDSSFRFLNCFLGGNLDILSGNIVTDTTTGMMIATGSTQLIGFWGATPAAQPAGTVDVLASLVTMGLRAASSNPPLNIGTGALTCGTLTIADGTNIVLNTTTGTKIGTATTQKLGFFNKTPVVQITTYTQTYSTASKTVPVNTSAAVTDTSGAFGFLLAADRTAVITAINALRTDVDNVRKVCNQIIDDLQLIGLIA